MKPIYFIVIFFFLSTSQAADKVYKWVDDDGVVHYSDATNPGSSKTESIRVNHEPSGSIVHSKSKARPKKPQEHDVKYKVSISSPKDNDTIHENSGNLSINATAASTSKNPRIAKSLLYSLEIDGAIHGETQANNAFTISNLDRGTHKVLVKLLNKKGKVLAVSKSITFHLKRNTINNLLHRPIASPNL